MREALQGHPGIELVARRVIWLCFSTARAGHCKATIEDHEQEWSNQRSATPTKILLCLCVLYELRQQSIALGLDIVCMSQPIQRHV